jgi:hypothetical protein
MPEVSIVDTAHLSTIIATFGSAYGTDVARRTIYRRLSTPSRSHFVIVTAKGTTACASSQMSQRVFWISLRFATDKRRAVTEPRYRSVMRLTRLQRAFMILIGLASLGLGTVAAMKEWSEAGVVTLLVSGLFLMIGSVAGVVPSMNIKEGSIQWPEPPKDESPTPTEADEASPTPTQPDPVLTRLRWDVDRMKQQFEDLMLLLEGPPDDGLTDEDRLLEAREEVKALEHDVAMRKFTGEAHDDGQSLEDLELTLARAREYLRREERRQQLLGGEVSEPSNVVDMLTYLQRTVQRLREEDAGAKM